jgi:methionine biosynthesis protein MetW
MGTEMGYLRKLFEQTGLANKAEILETLEPRPAGRLLDCGCGNGEFTARLARRAQVSECYGVECVDARIAEAAARGVIVTKADLNDPLPYEDGFFDIVHANQIIEHLSSTDSFLREVERVLRPDGYAVVSTNNLASWHNVFSLALGMQPMPMHVSNEAIVGNAFDPRCGEQHPFDGDAHLRIFSYRALRELCRYHGFAVQSLKTAGYYPLPTAVARLACRVDKVHGVYLIAKLRSRRNGR